MTKLQQQRQHLAASLPGRILPDEPLLAPQAKLKTVDVTASDFPHQVLGKEPLMPFQHSRHP